MQILKSRLGLAVCVVVALGIGLIAYVGYQVHQSLHPQRQDDRVIDFEAMMIRAEEVRFPASDGVNLEGWLLAGRKARPPVILCHGLGGSKGSLVNLGIALNKAGFPVLMFDFRGHGASGGQYSTLGVEEKRDILGAVDFLASLPEQEKGRVGIYGVGMGAHAAVLAAADRPALKVLVLDGLYPDPGYPAVRRVFAHLPDTGGVLEFLPRFAYALMTGSGAGEATAANTVERLIGRDLLFVAPAGDSRLAEEIQRMYERVPIQADADGNLIVLPATQSDALYAEHLTRYHERVVGFFDDRLAERIVLAAGPGNR